MMCRYFLVLAVIKKVGNFVCTKVNVRSKKHFNEAIAAILLQQIHFKVTSFFLIVKYFLFVSCENSSEFVSL